jgi:Uncharacterized protein conserved in bacteria (DUF2188)
MKRYHITHDDHQWRMEEEGKGRAIKTAETKKEVIEKMREYMSDKTGSVKIHKVDGKIEEERTYQRKDDPPETKG